jgi:deoxyribodipyrimidine photo-lyase
MQRPEPVDSARPVASQRAWPATRAEALARLAAFTPRMGGVYAQGRNHDLGPDDRCAVSLLSPYVRRRLVTERELVEAALGAHGARKAEKFIQEVFWRSYWKGWLEMRPGVWVAYARGRDADRAALEDDAAQAAAVARAEAGETGLAPFDAWARELVETNWLHNHARMWFASIWIFTLGLPWRLGADFFLRNLLDGDPASNTLGWRWVGGLHSQGKHYVARAANIAKFTGGRFRLPPGALDEDPAPLPPEARDAPLPLAPAHAGDADAPTALLLTDEDLGPDWPPCRPPALRAAATLQLSEGRSDRPVAEAVRAFDCGALADAAERWEAAGAPVVERLVDIEIGDLARWARRSGARRVLTAWAPVGPTRDFLDAARPALEAEGVSLAMARRDWDEAVWPHATAGYFRVKKKIPTLLAQLCGGEGR